MIPMHKSWTPPRKYIGTTVDVQPGTASDVKRRSHSAHAATPKLPADTSTPRVVISRNGAAENDVMPCQANESIRRSGYLLSPAKRSARS